MTSWTKGRHKTEDEIIWASLEALPKMQDYPNSYIPDLNKQRFQLEKSLIKLTGSLQYYERIAGDYTGEREDNTNNRQGFNKDGKFEERNATRESLPLPLPPQGDEV